MRKLLGEILTSKKAIATIVAVLLVATNKIGLNLPEEALTQIISAVAAYVVGQGMADFGKASKGLVQQSVSTWQTAGPEAPKPETRQVE